jgi:hypothetical protein
MHYPANALQILRPYILPLQRAVMHHYSRRQDAANRAAVGTWVRALRDAYAATGYLDALRATQ